MRFSGLLSLLLFITIITSCQREVDGGSNEVIAEDNIYLDKLVETDTTYPSGLDTLFITTYSYDASKRLVRKDETIFEAGTHNLSGNIIYKRFYNGTDTVPYKITSEEIYTNGEYYKDTMFLFYNVSNQVIKDSLVKYDATNIIAKARMTLAAAGTNRYYVREDYFDPNSATTIWAADSVLCGFNYSARNLLSCYDSVHSSPSGILNYAVNYSYTYDNKNNPFRKMSLPYLASSGYVDLGLEASAPFKISANNLATYTIASWSTGGSNTNTGQISYEYNSDGYPKIARYSSVSDPTKAKNFYFYRTL